jgi:hypothetical protein
MKKTTVWNRRASGLVLLAVVGGAARAQGPNADPRAAADPGAYRKLDGVWQCHFLEAQNKIERDYYSLWAFEAAKKWVHIFWSPVHKGVLYDYAWDGERLVLDSGTRKTIGTHKTSMPLGATLVIEDPRLRWKGWRCTRQPGVRWPEVRWPEDGLQFLDYARYPWLSGAIEDGPSIMKYRDPKQYEEWLKGQPR